jgi:PKD domain-containing protein
MLALVAAIPGGPTAVFTVDDASPVLGQVVHFNASGSLAHDQGNGRIVAYAFSFGDGSTTGSQASAFADHAYESVGTFDATVTVVDARHAQSTASLTIHVALPPPPVEHPDLVPIQARLVPADPKVNDTVNVTVVVLNRGGTAANAATITAYDAPENGTPAAAARANLSAPVNSSRSLSVFVGSIVVRLAGNHTLRILVTNVTPAETTSAGHELDVRFAVTASSSKGNGGGGGFVSFVPPVALVLGAAAVAAGVGAAYLFLRPRPPGPLEPPPASPPDRSPPPIWPP